ncbi:MAG: hypothetical protein L3J42_04125 [Hydrogenimonas sp.]|nr:hypothetical protein [Hydrogenimonas sp.]
MRIALYIAAVALLLFTSGCAARYPMGLDEESWKALSPEKRAELSSKQAKIDAQDRLQRERLRHEERMRELQIEKMREQRLNSLYARARYGEVVRVNISEGCIKLYKECERYRPISILLAIGETKIVALKTEYSKLKLRVRYDEQGVAIDDDSELDDFDAALFLPERWSRGRVYRLSLFDGYSKKRHILKNARLFISYFPIDTTISNSRYERR